MFPKRFLKTSCIYVKCTLESKETFDIHQSNTRGVEMIVRQLRAIFVDFTSEEAKSQFQLSKKAFLKPRKGLCFGS